MKELDFLSFGAFIAVVSPSSANVARNVKAALERLLADLDTQAAIAKKTGISEASLSKWRAGQVRPSVKALKALGQALGLDIDDFVHAPDDFEWLLAHRPRLAADREVTIRLEPVERYRRAWPAAWQGVQGKFKLLYAHRDGTIEISDIDFVRLGTDGIQTVMKNSNTEESRVWEYRGHAFAIDGFLYSILSEVTSGDELFFLIFSIPVGRSTGMIFGHFLARSVKEAMRASKAQSCVLLPATLSATVADAHGTYTAEELNRLRVLNRSIARHLCDAPTLALKDRLSRLFE